MKGESVNVSPAGRFLQGASERSKLCCTAAELSLRKVDVHLLVKLKVSSVLHLLGKTWWSKGMTEDVRWRCSFVWLTDFYTVYIFCPFSLLKCMEEEKMTKLWVNYINILIHSFWGRLETTLGSINYSLDDKIGKSSHLFFTCLALSLTLQVRFLLLFLLVSSLKISKQVHSPVYIFFPMALGPHCTFLSTALITPADSDSSTHKIREKWQPAS